MNSGDGRGARTQQTTAPTPVTTPRVYDNDGSLRALTRDFGAAWVAGIAMVVAMVLIAAIENLPIRDPDNLIPGYIRFPGIVLLAVLADIVPRVLWRARRTPWRPSALVGRWREVVTERWPASHLKFVLAGISAWYLCYATFRNLKSMAPFVNGHLWDIDMARLDRFLWLGREPAEVLHDLFGTGIAAHFFSGVYMVWIGLVPITIAIALTWTRHTRAGAWYVTAVAFDWMLGAALYLLLPSVGPIYSDPEMFASLPTTSVTTLAESMLAERQAVVGDPWGSGSMQTIAAFASLHVGIMVTICLMVEYVGLSKLIRVCAWVFLALTVLATIYLGWHFFVDTIAGAALGSFTVWAAAMATGNHVGLRPRLRRGDGDEAQSPEVTAAAGPSARPR